MNNKWERKQKERVQQFLECERCITGIGGRIFVLTVRRQPTIKAPDLIRELQ